MIGQGGTIAKEVRLSPIGQAVMLRLGLRDSSA
jgi:hypothetical protein